MAGETCGVLAGGRSSSSSGVSTAEEAARERIAVSSEEARRRADAQAETRAASFIAGGNCGGGPSPSLQSVIPTAAPVQPAPLPAVKALDPAEQKRIDAIVRPEYDRTFDGLTAEIVRLKRLCATSACLVIHEATPPAADAPLRAAVTARIGELTAQWVAKAQDRNLPPPTAGFDPYTASDRDLRGAFVWMEIGGAIPLQAAMTDGGARFRDDIFEAVALRTPGLLPENMDALRGALGDTRGVRQPDRPRRGHVDRATVERNPTPTSDASSPTMSSDPSGRRRRLAEKLRRIIAGTEPPLVDATANAWTMDIDYFATPHQSVDLPTEWLADALERWSDHLIAQGMQHDR